MLKAFSHARHDEHLVVHRQSEGHADKEDRHEADQRPRRAPEPGPAFLPDQHGQSEGTADGEQESECRHDRHGDAAEDHQQQHERQPDDQQEVYRHGVRQLVGNVLLDGDQAGDAHVHAGFLLDHVLLSAQRVDERGGALFGRPAFRRDQQLRGEPILALADELRVLDMNVAAEVLHRIDK